MGVGYYVITTKIPQYFHDVFDVPINSNGAFTALTIVGILISRLICLKLSSYLVNLNLMSLTKLRKMFLFIAFLTPSACFFIITLKNDNMLLDTCLIVASMFGLGFISLGDTPITAEFARDLAGSIFALTNTCACIGATLSPIFVTMITESFETKTVGWNFVFYITIAIYLIGSLIFYFFASAELQPWAASKYVPIDELNVNKRANIKSSA